jgi:TonB family protein
MIGWMFYSAALGLVLALTAEVLARAVRHRGHPERWVWAGAVAGTLVLPLLLPFLPRLTRVSTRVLALEGISLSPGAVAQGPPGASTLDFSLLLALAWFLGSAVLAVRLVWSMRSVQRIVGESRPLRHRPVELRLTRDTGPAVAGLFHPVVLLPEAFRRLPVRERRWILRHELEHVRARDPVLIWLAHGSRVLLPWNPVVWFLGRRLREGVEFDCDRRLLHRHPDPRSYGTTLLALTTTQDPSPLPVAAFREPGIPLERRFFSMTTPTRPLSRGLLAALSSLTALALAAACEFSPTYSVVSAPADTEAPRADFEAQQGAGDQSGPSFTPYTVAPNLTNRSEVIAALEAEYPPELRDAGVGGTSTVWFFIDAQGSVTDTRIHESSGSPELDRAAIRVARTMRFSPALNRDEPTPVWVAFPITFMVR